ncbi:hypothetical protein CLV67_101475 [Actinoplanes italicus]|uniref:Uncharacterized protein n=1 Tax=Actinoplanes italicus TaxID=113567 RepID=A0A2T0KQB3_9ACTN|nr:hypothetical protein CLV67_101475 [Actinoplanes italicus]
MHTGRVRRYADARSSGPRRSRNVFVSRLPFLPSLTLLPFASHRRHPDGLFRSRPPNLFSPRPAFPASPSLPFVFPTRQPRSPSSPAIPASPSFRGFPLFVALSGTAIPGARLPQPHPLARPPSRHRHPWPALSHPTFPAPLSSAPAFHSPALSHAHLPSTAILSAPPSTAPPSPTPTFPAPPSSAPAFHSPPSSAPAFPALPSRPPSMSPPFPPCPPRCRLPTPPSRHDVRRIVQTIVLRIGMIDCLQFGAVARKNSFMGQASLFGRAQISAMRDRTAARNYSPAREEFRREHERHRAWGLRRRHAEKLGRLRQAEPAFGHNSSRPAPGVTSPTDRCGAPSSAPHSSSTSAKPTSAGHTSAGQAPAPSPAKPTTARPVSAPPTAKPTTARPVSAPPATIACQVSAPPATKPTTAARQGPTGPQSASTQAQRATLEQALAHPQAAPAPGQSAKLGQAPTRSWSAPTSTHPATPGPTTVPLNPEQSMMLLAAVALATTQPQSAPLPARQAGAGPAAARRYSALVSAQPAVLDLRRARLRVTAALRQPPGPCLRAARSRGITPPDLRRYAVAHAFPRRIRNRWRRLRLRPGYLAWRLDCSPRRSTHSWHLLIISVTAGWRLRPHSAILDTAGFGTITERWPRLDRTTLFNKLDALLF